MLHEITHTSIGLEDIHPPAFYELNAEIKQQYWELRRSGALAKETDTYVGCKQSEAPAMTVSSSTIDNRGRRCQ